MIQTVNQKNSTIEFILQETIGIDFPRTLCHFDLSHYDINPDDVKSASINGVSVPFQISELRGTVSVFLSLRHYSKVVVLFCVEENEPEICNNRRIKETDDGILLQTANGAVCLPVLGKRKFDLPVDSLTIPAPISYLVNKRGIPMGKGWIDTYERVVSLNCNIIEDGPLWTTVRVEYVFDSHASFIFECTAADGEEFIRIRERSTCGPKSRWILMFNDSSGMVPDGMDLSDHTLYYHTRRLEYFSDRLHARLYPWTQATQIAALSEGIGVYASKTDDYVAWFVRANADWDGFKNTFVEFYERRFNSSCLRSRGGETIGDTFSWLPNDVKGNHTDDSAAFCAEAMLMEGRREYSILIGSKKEWHTPDPVPEHVLEWYNGPALTQEWNKMRSPLRRIIQFQGLISLDIVKDWKLRGTVLSAGILNSRHPAMEGGYSESITPLLKDMKKNSSAIAKEILNTLEILATGYVMGRGPGGTNPVTLRAVFPLAVLFREMTLLHSIPAYLEGEDKSIPTLSERISAMLLFLAYLTNRKSSYPGEFTMAPMSDPRSSEPTCLGMPNQNFFTDVYCVFGGVAMIFQNSDCSHKWLERANKMLGLQLDTFSDPESGVWEESHTYFNHVLRTLAPFVLEQRNITSESKLGKYRIDWFRDSRFICLCKAVFHFVTPKDPNANRKRMMSTLGDHRMELNWHTYNALAIGFADINQTLAANLVWMSLENGWSGTPSVSPVSPKLVSHKVAGLGAVLRGRADAVCGGESMVVLRAGYTWGHHNCDELEVIYYSGDEPVITEAGYGNPKTFSKIGPSGHSIMHPVDFVPGFYLSRANRGVIDEFCLNKPTELQILSGRRPVAFMQPPSETIAPVPILSYTQFRRVEWLEQAGHGVSKLTIIDRHDGVYRQQLNFHTGGVGVEHVSDGVCLIKGHFRNSLLTVNPAVNLKMQPDACNFTYGITAVFPEEVKLITTVIITAPKNIDLIEEAKRLDQ